VGGRFPVSACPVWLLESGFLIEEGRDGLAAGGWLEEGWGGEFRKEGAFPVDFLGLAELKSGSSGRGGKGIPMVPSEGGGLRGVSPNRGGCGVEVRECCEGGVEPGGGDSAGRAGLSPAGD
jgi:hypothetical protein